MKIAVENAVIYARYSSSNQREESIIGQIRDCRAYANKLGFKVIKEYTDEAKTGTTDRRPGFQQMIKDAESHRFTAIIVWKVDRFARNRYDSAIYKSKLKKNGVKVYSAMEAISDGPEGIIMEGLMESMAEYYSANLSENVKRGNYDSALEHKTLGVKVYGYRTAQDGTYELDPCDAAVVKRIFDERIEGRTGADIARGLNHDGFRFFGKKFNSGIIYRIIQNVKYTGVYKFKDYICEGGMPSIINRQTFMRVQNTKKKHKSVDSGAVVYSLTGKLFCGNCGSYMTGEYGTSKTGKKYYYYACRDCKKRVQKELIEDLIYNELVKRLSDDNLIETLAVRFEAYQEEKLHDSSVMDNLKSRLKETEKGIGNLIAAIEQGIITQSTKDRLEALEAEKEELKLSIKDEEINNKVIVSKEDFIFWVNELRSSIDNRDKLFDCFLNSAYVYDDHVTINTNLMGTNSTLKVDQMDGIEFECSSSWPALLRNLRISFFLPQKK